MELLLPMAAKKLDLSFDIDRAVPECASKAVVYGIGRLTRNLKKGSLLIMLVSAKVL